MAAATITSMQLAATSGMQWIPTGFLTTLCNLITFYQYFNKSDLMPLENSIQQSYLSIDIALIAIYTKNIYLCQSLCGLAG